MSSPFHTDSHAGQHEPNLVENLRREFREWRPWKDRAIVLAYAVMAGLAVVGFTLLAEHAYARFEALLAWNKWVVLLWIPACTVAVVWMTRRWFPGAAGSGIPQVVAVLERDMPMTGRRSLVSLGVSAAKIGLSSLGLLAGLSIGREGPSVQVAAGVMQHARHWLTEGRISTRALLVAGGAAGIAAAFNAPLAGIVFAIEELSKRLESASSGLIIAAIVLAGLMAVSAFGNLTYFGVLHVPDLGWAAFGPGLLTVLSAGVLGGLFAKLLAASLTGRAGRLSRLRAQFPLRFAAAAGLIVAVLGLVSDGATFGAGSEAVKRMLSGDADLPALYVPLKFLATWLTAWSGVPGGIFAPSLSIGAGIGDVVSAFAGGDLAPALVAVGMAAFLAAVTQAPLTSFIIVMEMVDGHSMVLSLMAASMLASLLSRLMTRPLYATLAEYLLATATAPTPAPARLPDSER